MFFEGLTQKYSHLDGLPPFPSSLSEKGSIIDNSYKSSYLICRAT